MASKFQNRLVGTIVLVALGVIVLPSLLDGQKKHYQDEFAAIPLVPKPGDNDELDMLPPASQTLPAQPPEGAAEEMRASNAAPAIDPVTLPVETGAGIDELPQPKPVPAPKPKVQTPTAPVGKAYVVQLGALKNAGKANEVVAKLRSAGFRAYTVPSTPVAGKITRILVGPDVSKNKLKSSLDEMHRISGLNGVVMNYTP